MSSLNRRRLRRSCAIVAAAALAWAYAIHVTGGFVLDLGGIRVSSRTPRNPLIIVGICLIGAWVLTPGPLRRNTLRVSWASLTSGLDAIAARVTLHGGILASTVAALLAAGTMAIGLMWGSHVVGGSDSYGYVSQAHLWATGTLRVEQPPPGTLPAGIPAEALIPLGYRLGADRATLAPVYAPGLPMLMSVFERLWGRDAVFHVVPPLAGLAVWTTFLLGRMLAGPLAGVLSAALLTTSPTFVLQLTHAPMSDIAAMAWWTCALVLAPRVSRTSALAAGLAAGAAILTRPNLVPLAMVPGTLLLLDFGRRRVARHIAIHRLLLFAAGSIPACLVVAVLNGYWNGSPLESGYGPLAGTLYRWEHWWPNVLFYTRWAAATQTPLVFLAIAAPFVLWRRFRSHPERRIALGLCVGIAIATYACYAFYMPFEPWWSLRFMLPAFPAGFALMTAAFTPSSPRLLRHATWLLPILLAGVVLTHGIRFSRATGAYDSSAERRYASIGRFVARHMPERAIFVTLLHSGSIRYYSGRLTARYDFIPPDRLDETLAHLRGAGYTPFILVDDVERQHFVQRFSRESRVGGLEWPPLADVDGVKVFAVDGIDRSEP